MSEATFDGIVAVVSVFLLGMVAGVKLNVWVARHQNPGLALIQARLRNLANDIQDAMSNVREIKP